MKRLFLIANVAMFTVTACSFALAAPNLISVQGRITDPSGNPVADGSYLVQLRLYSAPVAGTTLWDNGYRTVPLAKGLFTYQLGDSTALPVSVFTSNPQLWLGIKVGTDPEISPRTQLVSVPYSKSADYAGTANSASTANSALTASSVDWSGITSKPAGFADGVDDNTTYSASSPVGLTGTTFNLIPGSITDAHIGASANIQPSKISGTAATLSGTQTYTGGNYFNNILKVGDSAFYASPSSYAVQIGKTPVAYSDRLLNVSRTYNTASTVYGVNVELFNNTSGSLFGVTSSAYSNASGFQVKGGVFVGQSDGTYRIGAVCTGASKTSNLTTGVSYGVQGSASYGSDVFGVYGSATGSGTGSGNAYGVYGTAFNAYNSWAGYFNGYVNVTGVLSKGGGSFRIDHPLDPENKLLQHSFVESPDMMNIYNGIAALDGSGKTTVTLPSYFMALNRDFRYQLTAIGGPGPNLYIESEVQGNTFSIAGGASGMKVSWQVTGIRKDAFANANRIQVEVDKQPDQRGKYLHPAAFNLPEERGIDYENIKAAREAREQQKTDGPR